MLPNPSKSFNWISLNFRVIAVYLWQVEIKETFLGVKLVSWEFRVKNKITAVELKMNRKQQKLNHKIKSAVKQPPAFIPSW